MVLESHNKKTAWATPIGEAHICQLSVFHILLENRRYSVILLAYNMSPQHLQIHSEQNGFFEGML